MNCKERALVDLLKRMKGDYAVEAVKTEFEAEGTTLDELLRLKRIAAAANLGIILKIGGPEDVWGILQARKVGVDTIVAPMVESGYAAKKFLEAMERFIPADERDAIASAANIETNPAVMNLNEILKIGKEKGLQSITVGRVDLVGSLGLGRDAINSARILSMTKYICECAKHAGMQTAIGGGIEKDSQSFVFDLVKNELLHSFETRKVVFSVSSFDLRLYEEAIKDAHRVELLWIDINQSAYHEMASKEAHRIQMLQKRISQ